MDLPKGLSIETICDAVRQDDMIGFCVKCGFEAHPVEPDAEEYSCEECGSRAVYGADQILLHTVA